MATDGVRGAALAALTLLCGGAGPTENRADLDFLLRTVEADYAGWPDKRTPERSRRLDAQAARLEALVDTADDAAFGAAMRDWIALFDDRHLSISGLPADTPAPVPTPEDVALDTAPRATHPAPTPAAFRRAIGRRGDAVEGLWTLDGNYLLGVIEAGDDRFEAVVLETRNENWKRGEVKAVIERTPDGLRATFARGDKVASRHDARLLVEDTLLSLSGWAPWRKVWPKTAEADAVARAFGGDAFFLRRLDEETLWLRLPRFGLSARDEIEALLAENEALLAATPNLLIDLRGNGGGNDAAYAALLPWLYDRPIVSVGAAVRNTPGNATRLTGQADAVREEAPDVARFIDGFVAKMATSDAAWVMIGDEAVSFTVLDAPRPMPERVGILIDGAASTAEEFVLAARQSRKVTLFGRANSAGVLDYSNVLDVAFPSGRYGTLGLPISRSLRLPDMPVDPTGIAPDIRIGEAVGDPIGFAAHTLRRRDLPPVPPPGLAP